MRSGVFSLFLLCAATAVACAGRAADPPPRVVRGFTIEPIASVNRPRELAALPDGNLIAGTAGGNVYIVPHAETKPARPEIFASFDDRYASGVAYAVARHEIYVATEHHVFAISYTGDSKAGAPRRIADVRTGPVAPGTDGDIHNTTSVAFSGGQVYAAAGSSCNATVDDGKKPCVEVDPTRAAVSVIAPDGSGLTQRAKRIRNAIALAVNPETGSVWVGDAGQDDLPEGHPYELLDDLSAHPGDADYGWPVCEENHHAYWMGYDCSRTVEPLVELPAYSTIVGAAFYPLRSTGKYAFPSTYRGGLFAATHGSWHRDKSGCYVDPPRVVFIAMHGDKPAKPVDWNDPTTQWSDFVTGFQSDCRTRTGRPSGITVGPSGSLFVADEVGNEIYRIRPAR